LEDGNKVKILLVDDQPGKLLSYEAILAELDETLIKANSAREALEQLLRHDIAVVLVDVCMPELDGFQLAEMIREHPRFEKTAIIFISAVLMSDLDRIRGYEAGAVDYVPVPVVPEVLRAKVRIFTELHRKTRALEALNAELEKRVEERTEALAAYSARLRESERRRSLALAAGQMGSWDWNIGAGTMIWDEGLYRILGFDAARTPTPETMQNLVHPEDRDRLFNQNRGAIEAGQSFQAEFRICRPDGEIRWCSATVVPTLDEEGRTIGLSGVVADVTDRRKAEHRQSLLVREVDHRAKNALAVVQSVLRLTRAPSVAEYVDIVEGRIRAIASVHTLLSESRWEGADLARLAREELEPYQDGKAGRVRCDGPAYQLRPATAQTLALAFHELATNAAKYGALSTAQGSVSLTWRMAGDMLALTWTETGGPTSGQPKREGFGVRVIRASIEQQLSGTVAFDWRAEGLACTIAIPRTEVTEQTAPMTGSRPAEIPSSSAALPPRLRVMLVEDEAIVGLMMEQILTGLGIDVVGPVGTLQEALAAAGSEELDCAILDVNLKGAVAYPIADRLRDRGIPFVFLTGYDSVAVDDSYVGVPMLQKPVEAAALRGVLAGLLGAAAKAPVAAEAALAAAVGPVPKPPARAARLSAAHRA